SSDVCSSDLILLLRGGAVAPGRLAAEVQPALSRVGILGRMLEHQPPEGVELVVRMVEDDVLQDGDAFAVGGIDEIPQIVGLAEIPLDSTEQRGIVAQCARRLYGGEFRQRHDAERVDPESAEVAAADALERKSTRLNSSH